MKLLLPKVAIPLASLFLILLSASQESVAQKKISCPDGDHIEIDVRQIQIQYDASSFAGTLSSLSVLGSRLEIAPKKLQEAAVATQQWDEFLKGLAAGYNNCAVTRQQYADGLNRIYPRLKEDAGNLEEIRKILSEGRKADEKRLQNLLDSYYNNLHQFAQASGKEIILERIGALSVQVATGQTELLGQQKTDTERILQRLNELEQSNKQTPLPTPEEVSAGIAEIRKSLAAKADEAEAAYRKGYELLDRFRFQEAIPYLQHALGIIKLPDFYLALGRAYLYEPDLNKAQQILEEGLAQLADGQNQQHEASLAVFLGIVLENKGDLDGALGYAQRAFEIDKKVYGPEHSNVARDANNIGMILENKGDLDGALSYTQQAYEILKKAYGPDHPEVAAGANNIGQILQDKGDLDGALRYAQQALETDKRLYGPDHPQVAL